MTQGQPVISVGTVHISERAKQYVMDVLNRQRLSYGSMTRKLESEFAKFHGCRFGVMSNSGTSALQIALQTLKEIHGWADGDEVLVPAVTFVATANVVLHNRMKPILVDVDPLYYSMDPSLVETKITPKTRCMIPVHLFGQPADMDPLLDIARKYKLKVIEDSCETMFAQYKGRATGSLGDIACFSTYAAHLIVTGVGGLNTTNNPEYAVRLLSLMNHGRDSIYISIDDDKGKTSEELRMVIAGRFKFTHIGHSFRATEMEAALGLAQLEEWPSIIAARRANAQNLTKRLTRFESELQLPQVRPGNEHSFMMYPIVLKNRPKEELVNYLEQGGIGTRDMLPLTNQPVYHDLLGWKESDYPVAQKINANGFYIGCHQGLVDSDLEYVEELFERFFRNERVFARDGACLVLSSCGKRDLLEDLVPEMPLDLFQRKVAFADTLHEAESRYLTSQGFEIYSDKSSSQILHALMNGAVVQDQANVVVFPADGQHNPRDIGRVLLALERGQDMAIASRFVPGGSRRHAYGFLSYRSIGNRLFTVLANLLCFGNLTDTLSVFRGIRKARLSELSQAGSGLSGFYRLSLFGMRQNWKMTDVPTEQQLHIRFADHVKEILSIVPLLFVLLGEWARSFGTPSANKPLPKDSDSLS